MKVVDRTYDICFTSFPFLWVVLFCASLWFAGHCIDEITTIPWKSSIVLVPLAGAFGLGGITVIIMNMIRDFIWYAKNRL